MFKHILVGFDGSDSSKRAFEKAVVLAHEGGGEVLALTVVRAPEAAELEGEVDESLREADGPLGKAIGWAKQRAKQAGVACTFRKQIGHPAELLTRVAGEGKFDLVVLGRRGHSPVKHWLVGSTTDRIVDHAPCAVLIVH
jgi:nucleotide-binding universal stress UspA family protein